MPTDPDFNVGDVVYIADNPLLVPDARGVRGIVRAMNPGATFGKPIRGTNRWDYTVDFDMPLGLLHGIPEGILTSCQS